MLRARNGSRDAIEAVRHGDIHRVDRNAAVQIGLLGKGAADGERKIGGRRHDIVRHDLGVLAGHANRAGETGGRIEPHLAAGRDRTAVGGRAAQSVDANRIPVGDQGSGDSGELESGLVVAEFPIREPDRPLGLRLGDGPAQLKRERERAGHSSTGKRQSVVRKPGVEAAVDLQVERPVVRQRRRAGDADRIRAARIGRDVDRRPASSEPARSRDVERRQGVAARLGEADLPQPDTPVAGRVAWRPSDGRVAFGCPGHAQAR